MDTKGDSGNSVRRSSEAQAAYEIAVSEAVAKIDGGMVDQSVLNNCRDSEFYHAVRKLRPDFYVDGTEDFIEKAALASGEVIRRLRWNQDNGTLEIIKSEYDQSHTFVDVSSEIITPLNRRNFKVFRNPTAELWIQDLNLQKVMPAKDYLRVMNVNPKFHSDALQAFTLIKPDGEEPPKLELIVDKQGYLVLPHASDIYTENDFAKTILACMRLGKDGGQLKMQFDATWNVMNPKQRCDVAAATGIPIMNIVNDLYSTVALRSHLLSYGITESAKSWTHIMALKQVWGIFLTRDSLLTGDALGSTYRLYAILSSTNLPVYIDDSTLVAEKIRDILKSSGSTIRGKADQTFNQYTIKATLLTTAQHNVFLGGAISDEQAINRRLYIQPYNKRVEASRKGSYDALLDDVASGGFIYHVLKKYPARTLFECVRYYKNVTCGNATLAGILLGLALLGKLEPKYTDAVEWEIESADGLVAAYDLILRDVARMEAGLGIMDNEAKNLATMMKVENDEVYLNGAYLDWVNSSKTHPLAGKFRNLGALRELESIFSAQILRTEIYNKRRNKRIGGSNGTFAVLPRNRTSNSSNMNLTGSLTDIIVDFIDNKYDTNDNNVRHVRQNIPEELRLDAYIIRCTNASESNTGSSSTKMLDVRQDKSETLNLSKSPLPSASPSLALKDVVLPGPEGGGESPPKPKRVDLGNTEGICPVCGCTTSELYVTGGGWKCKPCLDAAREGI